MATERLPAHPPHETRDFVLGIVLGLTAMLVVVLFTLYGLGRLDAVPFGAAESQVAPADEAAEPRPTAVWRFRPEWLTPVAKTRP